MFSPPSPPRNQRESLVFRRPESTFGAEDPSEAEGALWILSPQPSTLAKHLHQTPHPQPQDTKKRETPTSGLGFRV